MAFRNLQPIVVNCEGAAYLLGTTESAFRKMVQRGIGPRTFSFYETDIRFLVVELQKWAFSKAGLDYLQYLREHEDNSVEAKPKRGRGRPRKN